jgi:purine-binding chemotaxis protein CheW
MSSTIESNLAHTAAQAVAGKYLTLSLAEELYGIPVLKVREIIKLVNITPVPQMPAHVKGVVNLRGKIIPVVDLRLKFEMPGIPATQRTCIVVVQIASASQAATALLGLVVDGVEEVLNLNAVDIEKTPDFGTAVDTSYLVGMGKIKGKVVALLDIDRVVGPESHAAVIEAVNKDGSNS